MKRTWKKLRGRKTPAKRLPKNALIPPVTFPEALDRVLAPLSVRARNVLFCAAVRNLDTLLRLTYAGLLKQRNCGRKTAAEIVALQESLRSAPQEAPRPPDPLISYDHAPAEVMDAIRGRLTVRGVHTLESLGVSSLGAFMALERDRLMRRRDCGTKTANLIRDLQEGLANFARERSREDCGFSLERLLEAPCLFSAAATGSGAPSERFLADAAAPAPWLASWVRELATTDRHARVFSLRMGMLGTAPVTLDAVARDVGGVTRERVRQMQVKVERKAAASYQQRRLRPLVAEAARVVAENGGRMVLADLTEAVLCRGPDGEQLRHATGLMVFFAGLQVWADAGLRAPRNDIVCDRTRESDALPV